MHRSSVTIVRIAALAQLLAIVAVDLTVYGAPTAEQIEFFENRIRPVLVENCYVCHNSADTAEAGLALDSRDGIRSESAHGTAVVPGDADKSLLLQAVRHEIDGLEMPKDGPQLEQNVIDDLTTWIEMGAPDPRDRPPSAHELAEATSWEAVLAKRKQWWSFQPITSPAVPHTTGEDSHPIDAFLRRRQKQAGLQQARRADRATLLRRLTFVLTGLPPTSEQIESFTQDESPQAYEALVDRLLGSERFGERWARHWMDMVRYADSHGSEGDPTIPHAYRYRDYLIRAFNENLPYDQLVREHIAGDLLDSPRLNHQLGINESSIGTAHWRMVFHGFAPTDALAEKVRFTDDQINVFGKAFLGITISCARCHNHKFDAISQQDYYALFGILGSCRPALLDVNTVARQRQHVARLVELKYQLRMCISEAWLAVAAGLAQDLLDPNSQWNQRRADAEEREQVLSLWRDVKEQLAADKPFAAAWAARADAWDESQAAVAEDGNQKNLFYWNLAHPDDYAQWYRYGNGLRPTPAAAGEFAIATDGRRVIDHIFPAGVYTGGLSTKHRGFLVSKRLQLDDECQVWFRIAGAGESTVRYSVQDYPRDGTVYPIEEIEQADWYLHSYDLAYWQGDDVHFELATARDAPLQVRDEDRSWFGVREVFVRKKGEAAPFENKSEFLEPLFDSAASNPPESIQQLADQYAETLRTAVTVWRDGHATDGQALFLHGCLRDGLLPNGTDVLASIQDLLDEYRELEAEIALPTRVPGLVEADACDQPLFERGNHHEPLEPVARRFLEAIDPTPFSTQESGRQELAECLLRPDNPLTARVIVNRTWHHVFGRGIVETPDNFGRLGGKPSHPKLLDYLAHRFMQEGWSIKRAIRLMLTSEAWQATSLATERASRIDPANRWLSHAHLRRLDAEAIRDALLSVSGNLDQKMYGPTVPANGDSPRRSIYIAARRNSLDSFLQTFDAPVPFAPQGRRNVTNVPAQALTMLNDPFVLDLADAWAAKVVELGNDCSSAQIVRDMFQTAIGRVPLDAEVRALADYRDELANKFERDSAPPTDAKDSWARVALAIFNLKEFVYLR